MPKLRKMLGRADDPEIVALMRAIETQSRETLARWALDCAERRYLPLLPDGEPAGKTLRETAAAVRSHLNGTLTKKELKPLLTEARKIALSDPAEQAAARAAATAFGVSQTPTNALGFTFYGAAAAAYREAGTAESQECYDRLAAAELTALLRELEAVSVPDEPNPVRPNWSC